MKRTKEERAAALEVKAMRARAEANGAKDERIKALLRAHDLVRGTLSMLEGDALESATGAVNEILTALEELEAPLQ